MQYRQLGRAGVKVSAIGLGSYLTIGMSIDDELGRSTFRAALDCGINFFDTADAYNLGQAEQALGRYLSDVQRSDIVLATKVHSKMSDNVNDRGLSAKHIYEGCRKSLKRLNVNYVDLLQCHRPDSSVPLEETVRAMDDLRRQGLILYWGTSEWPAWMIAQANATADRYGWAPAVSNQPRYSLLYRQPEMELWPFCARNGIGNVVFSPLAHGLLTGKYQPGQPPPAGTRAADPKQNGVLKAMYWEEIKIEKAHQLNDIAKGAGISTPHLALAWVLRRSEVSSAIIGASKVEQVKQNAAAAEVKLSDDVLKKLDELFPGPKVTYPG